jgi:hypothetical protein
VDRATAEKLMSLYHLLNEATAIINTMPSEEEQRQFRRPLGELMQTSWLDFAAPIVREHPDLDPDRQAP